MPSFSRTVARYLAAVSSLPGGLLVLMRTRSTSQPCASIARFPKSMGAACCVWEDAGRQPRASTASIAIRHTMVFIQSTSRKVVQKQFMLPRGSKVPRSSPSDGSESGNGRSAKPQQARCRRPRKGEARAGRAVRLTTAAARGSIKALEGAIMRINVWRASVLGILVGLLSLPMSELRTFARQQQPPPPLKVPAQQAPTSKDQKDQSKVPQGEFGITVEVPLVNLEVVATDQDGNPITGLRKANFRVLEDGVVQQVTNFAPTEAAITTVLLMEFIALFGGWLTYNATNWSYQFVNQLQKDDYIALVSFDLNIRIEVDFTKNKMEVQNYLGHMVIPGFREANLFDAVMETLDNLKDIKGRKSILIVATGLDTFSKHTLDQCLKRVKQTDVTIFAVGIAHAFSNYLDNRGALGGPQRLTFLQGENQLRAFAEMTGGRAFFPQFEGE